MKKIFRKIHLWLSVPFGLFITLICFSGAMMVFEKEITELCRPDLYFVREATGKPLPLDSLMEQVAATLPDSVSMTGVTISPDPERTYQVSLSKPRRASIYVNQYTGEVTGRSERLPFFDTMFHLHRWLMGSAQSKDGGMSVGKLLVGISTLVLVIVLLTGILMWLTNRRKPLKKSLTISFTKGWPRFWHDLHVAGGIYATIFLLALALTGLTWSFSWYRTGFYGMFGVEASAGGRGDAAQGREGRGHHGGEGRPDGRGRHGHGEGREAADSLHGKGGHHDQEHRRGGRPHGSAEAAPQGHEAAQESAETTPQARARLAEVATDSLTAPAETTVTDHDVQPADRQGRHGRGGRGGRGRYHHDGDSTGAYAGRHHGDSLRPHHRQEGEQMAVASEDSSRSHRGADRTLAATNRQRTGARRSGDATGRMQSHPNNKRKDVQRTDTATARPDTAAIPLRTTASRYAHWQEIYEQLAQSTPGYQQITLSDGSASVVPAGRRSLRAADRFEFDTESGQITGSQPYAQQEKAGKVRGGVYTVHVGSWGGMLTRIITFLAALLGATLPLTGYYLWIRCLINKSGHKPARKA